MTPAHAENETARDDYGVILSGKPGGSFDTPACGDTNWQEAQEHLTPGASCFYPARTLPKVW